MSGGPTTGHPKRIGTNASRPAALRSRGLQVAVVDHDVFEPTAWDLIDRAQSVTTYV